MFLCGLIWIGGRRFLFELLLELGSATDLASALKVRQRFPRQKQCSLAEARYRCRLWLPLPSSSADPTCMSIFQHRYHRSNLCFRRVGWGRGCFCVSCWGLGLKLLGTCMSRLLEMCTSPPAFLPHTCKKTLLAQALRKPNSPKVPLGFAAAEHSILQDLRPRTLMKVRHPPESSGRSYLITEVRKI